MRKYASALYHTDVFNCRPRQMNVKDHVNDMHNFLFIHPLYHHHHHYICTLTIIILSYIHISSQQPARHLSRVGLFQSKKLFGLFFKLFYILVFLISKQCIFCHKTAFAGLISVCLCGGEMSGGEYRGDWAHSSHDVLKRFACTFTPSTSSPDCANHQGEVYMW